MNTVVVLFIVGGILTVAATVAGMLLTVARAASAQARLRATERLRATPVSRIADVGPQRVVRLVGTVLAIDGDPLVAPATGKACAYWTFEIRQHNDGLTTLFSATDARDFWIEDASGRALVKSATGALWLARAEVVGETGYLQSEAVWGTFRDPNALEMALFERYGVAWKGFFGTKSLEYTEERIDVGERVTVLGRSNLELDTSVVGPGYRAPGKRLVIGHDGETPVIVSDDRVLAGGKA